MTLQQQLAEAVQALYNLQPTIDLSRTDEQFGDFATNVAMRIAKEVKLAPREVAEAIVAKLQTQAQGQPQGQAMAEYTIAGPGFINIKLSLEALKHEINNALAAAHRYGANDLYAEKTVVVEYSDPNPFKVLHAGHLYTSVVGDAIANLFAASGATVHRVNFGGDVGLHVGKAMWGILHALQGEYPEKLNDVPEGERADWIAAAYVTGSGAYDEDELAKAEIIELNRRVYQLHEQADRSSAFAQIYWTTRQWSYDYFNAFYQRLGTQFEKYYPESATFPIGLATVKLQLNKGVYTHSRGAVVFEGEPHGLHTRVFINSNGLPTYEAKDVGLIMAKWSDYHFDKNIMITGNDIIEYMKVVLTSIKQFAPQLADATTHITHGMVKLQGGVKMSSRKGNFLRAVDVLDEAAAANETVTGKQDERVVIGAVKYAFLKQRIGGDIIYDPKESVSLEGNSGPYLQYTHARAMSILQKASQAGVLPKGELSDLIDSERSLARKITEFPEVVTKATLEMMPHSICTYLYELAQVFNRFYEHNRVIGDERQQQRLQLITLYAQVLRSGMALLGIAAPESM